MSWANIAEQRLRFEDKIPQQPIDNNLLAALEAGLPDCSGVALGVDRVAWRRTSAKDRLYGRPRSFFIPSAAGDSEPDTLAPALARIPTISLRDFATIRALFMRPGVARRAMPTFG